MCKIISKCWCLVDEIELQVLRLRNKIADIIPQVPQAQYENRLCDVTYDFQFLFLIRNI